jgi:hypothetical protein
MATIPSRLAIAAAGLRKSFGDQVVLDGIDLEVPEGTIFALLGPNGAGKTTTVHILSTLIGADGGEVGVAGHDVARDPDAVRAAIGVTGQLTAVDNLLSGEENLLLMADLRHLERAQGRRRAAELLERFDLTAATSRPRPSPAACGGASTWPWAWSATRGSSSWTSRPPAWTRAAAAPCGRSSATWSPGGGHDLPDHPVPGGGRRARRPDRPAGPRPAGRRGHPRRPQAPHPRRPHPPPGPTRAARGRRCRGCGSAAGSARPRPAAARSSRCSRGRRPRRSWVERPW